MKLAKHVAAFKKLRMLMEMKIILIICKAVFIAFIALHGNKIKYCEIFVFLLCETVRINFRRLLNKLIFSLNYLLRALSLMIQYDYTCKLKCFSRLSNCFTDHKNMEQWQRPGFVLSYLLYNHNCVQNRI